MTAPSRSRWPSFEQGNWYALAPVPLVAWPAFRLATGAVRWEYLVFLVIPPLLAFASRTTKKLFIGLYPLGLVGLLYDAMGLVQNVGLTESKIHLCDLRAVEAQLFGFTTNGEPATLHDWLQARATLALDVYFAVPYALFIFSMVAFAIFLWRKDFRALQRFGWTFFLVNLAGFVTYHVYPAAPPWYFHTHGCVVDMTVTASEGPNLARVDAWLGYPYFHGMYARASDVFGAVPSLHVAYPLVIVFEGWRHLGTKGRGLALWFWLSMCGAAVYLDHHWVLDVVVGTLYAALSVAAIRHVFAVRERAPDALAARSTS